MPLTCGCGYDWEPGQLICYGGEDFEPLLTSRRKRCRSCKELIEIRALCVKFEIYKIPEHEVEINIHGEDGEIRMAPRYLCEKCGEIYLNLKAVGFRCVWVEENMAELLREYQEIYKPSKLST